MTNQTIITGNITNDLEVRQAGNSQVLKFGLGVRGNFKKDETNFIQVEAWGRAAEIISEYCQKGSKLLVIGELKQNRFQDKEGQNREKVYVNLDKFEFLDTKGNNQQKSQPQQQRGQAPTGNNPFANNNVNDDIEDLPF
ncbi:single-stranded DNA-binding protein [Staphylococcus hominis]|uniref:single-stranded DNA-binding protein n=1 Tax=Staphylococcus hominis TaxID=1290 RepID=UPI001F55D765|nr:single-stranded DNA-binding protein [Staphylococcus hominis]MCI2885850.1 single-stranded DNA-binding protein [Staphylococcus hominis]